MLQGVWKERVTQLQGGVKESPLPHQLWHRNFSFPHRAGEETPPPYLDRFDGWVLQLDHPVPIVLKVVHKLLLPEQLIGLEILEGKETFCPWEHTGSTEWSPGEPNITEKAPKAQTSLLACLSFKTEGARQS